MIPRRQLRAVSAAILIVGASATSGAQPAPTGDSAQQVFVHDSTDVTYKFALADRMEHLRQWDTAADTLQEIIEKYSDRVVVKEKNQSGLPVQYIGALWAAQARLAQWPAEGLASYRLKFEPKADALLKTAGENPADLHRILTRYFVTKAALLAGRRLIDHELTAGHFAAAAGTAQRVLSLYPNLGPDRAPILFAAGVADHLQHQEKSADDALHELQSRFPKAVGHVSGQDVVLAEELEKLLKLPAPVAIDSPDSWPMFGGNARRDRIGDGHGQAKSPPLFSISLSKPVYPSVPPQIEDEIKAQQSSDLTSGMMLDVMPVADSNQLFFQDGAKIYGYSLESGLPLSGWAKTYPGDPQGAYSAGTGAMPSARQLTVSIDGDSVFAVMGQEQDAYTFDTFFMAMRRPLPGGAKSQISETRLVCLDRRTGQLRWADSMGDVPDTGSLRSLSMSSCPLVVGQNVYVIARGRKSGQFEDCYVLCFNRADGKYRWACYIASANVTNFGFTEPSNDRENSISHLASAGGRIYVQSNVGAVAAIDAYSGCIDWLDIYPRRQQSAGDFSSMRGISSSLALQAMPWTFNAPVVNDGRLFVLPIDGQNLSVYDLSTGREIKQIDLADFGQPNTLLAAKGDEVFFAGDSKLWAVDWTGYDSVKFAAGDRSCVNWCADVFDSPIRGRIFLTRNIAFVPTRNRLYRVDMRTGKIIDTYPSHGDWTGQNASGNVLVAGDKLIIAGAEHVDVYADPAVAIAKLEAEEKSNPKDAGLRLRHAVLLFSTGDVAAAMNWMDQAIELSQQAGDSDERSRIFQTVMRWERQLAAQTPPAAVGILSSLFDRAGATATSPAQLADYKIARADFARDNHDFASEVRFFQQVLSDSTLRRQQIAGKDNQLVEAGQIARRGIDAVLTAGGAQWYASYEQQALRALQAARSTSDPGAMLAVFQEFPNASAAPTALREAAAAYKSVGDWSMANQLLHQALFNYPKAIDRASVIQQIAANDLAGNQIQPAITWINRLSKSAPSGRIKFSLPASDGQILDLTYTQALQQLHQALRKQLATHVPDLRLAPPEPGQANSLTRSFQDQVIGNVDALLVPEDQCGPVDRVVTWSENTGLSIYAAGQVQPIAQNNGIHDQPGGISWLGGKLLVWDDTHLFVLNGSTAQTLFQMDLASQPIPSGILRASVQQEVQDNDQMPSGMGGIPPALLLNRQRIFIRGGGIRLIAPNIPRLDAPVEQPANPQIAQVICAGDHILISTTDGRLIAIDPEAGKITWQIRLSDKSINRIEANDFFAAAAIPDGQNGALDIIDLFTGSVLRRISSKQGMVNFAISDDDWLVFTLPNQICQQNLDESAAPTIPGQSASIAFSGLDNHDQLRLIGHQLLALSDAGTLIRIGTIGGDDAAVPIQKTFGTGMGTGGSVVLGLDWPSLYAIGDLSVSAYDLRTNTGNQWTVPVDGQFSESFIARNNLVIRCDSGVKGKSENQLLIYSRQPTAHGESGRLNYIIPLSTAAKSVQAVEGGIYYLSNSHRLHFLQGNGLSPQGYLVPRPGGTM